MRKTTKRAVLAYCAFGAVVTVLCASTVAYAVPSDTHHVTRLKNFNGSGCSATDTATMATDDLSTSTLNFAKFTAMVNPSEMNLTAKKRNCRASFRVEPPAGKGMGHLRVQVTGMAMMSGDSEGTVKITVYVQNKPAHRGTIRKLEKGAQEVFGFHEQIDFGGGKEARDVVVDVETTVTDPRPADTYHSLMIIDTLDVAALTTEQLPGLPR